jgi:hypothetical protein
VESHGPKPKPRTVPTATPQHRSYSDEASAHADLALSRVTDGELDGAREAPRTGARPGARTPHRRLVASAARVHDALRGRRPSFAGRERGLDDAPGQGAGDGEVVPVLGSDEGAVGGDPG